MTVHEVWNLKQFLTRNQIGFDGDQFILTSEKCPEYEITLDCDENCKGRLVWHIAIDPMPYSEETMVSWMDLWEVKEHPANAADDWDPGKYALTRILMDIYKKMPFPREAFDNKVNELLARGENNENDRTDGTKEIQAD